MSSSTRSPDTASLLSSTSTSRPTTFSGPRAGQIYTLDTFSSQAFIVKDFIESLTDASLPTQRKSLSSTTATTTTTKQAFDPKPLIRTFEHTLARLRQLSSDLETRENELSGSVRRAESQHNTNIQSRSQELERTVEAFHRLERSLDGDGDTGGNAAMQIGERLEELDRQRQRAQDAKFILQCWVEVSERGDLSALDDVRRMGGGEGKVRCAHIARQLLNISQRLDASASSANGTPQQSNGVNGHHDEDDESPVRSNRSRGTAHNPREIIEKFLEMLEKDLLKSFDDFYRRQNFPGMMETSLALRSFSSGQSVISLFVNQHQFFIDRAQLISEDLAMDPETWDRLADPDCEPPGVEPSLQSLLDEVKLVCQEESFIIKRAFPFHEEVLARFLQRVFQQSIQQKLEMVLNKADSISSLAFLRSLQSSRSYIAGLVEDLKQHGLTEHPEPASPTTSAVLDQQLDELFVPYFTGSSYIEREKRNLGELFEGLLFKFQIYHSRRRKMQPSSYLGQLAARGGEYISNAREAYTKRLDTAELPARQKAMLLRIAGLHERGEHAGGVGGSKEVDVTDEDGQLSLGTTKRMLKWLAEGVGRSLELAAGGGAETPREVRELLHLLVANVGEIYLETALDSLGDAAAAAEAAKGGEPDLGFLGELRGAVSVLGLCLTTIRMLLLPLAAGNLSVRRELEKFTTGFTERMEGKVDLILNRTLDASLAWSGKLLAGQKKTDFRPRDDGNLQLDRLQTPTCAALTGFLSKVHTRAVLALGARGSVLEAFNLELAIGLRTLLLVHFRSFAVSQIGALTVSKDIDESLPLSIASVSLLPRPSNNDYSDQDIALPSPTRATLSSELAVTFGQQVLPHLHALFPGSVVHKLMFDASKDGNELERYSSAQVQFLIYAATNNLPGISQGMPLISMYDYLKDTVRAYFQNGATRLSTRSLPPFLSCTKPMAETMFRCAIEAGDHELVQQLLNRQELGLDVNEQVCTVNYEFWTAIERSTALNHVRMVKMLVSRGVDINKTHRGQSGPKKAWDPRFRSVGDYGCRGALEQAIHVRATCFRDRSTSITLEVIELLLQAGGDFRSVCLSDLLIAQDAQAIRMLLSARIRAAHQCWLENGYIHGIFHRLDPVSISAICDELDAVNIDVNYALASGKFGSVWDVPPTLPQLLDVAIERGLLELVVRLRASGASYSQHTMTAAVRSRNSSLLHYLLSHGAVADSYSAHFRTTPIAEAVRTRQREVYHLLAGEGCLRQISQEYRFCSILAAAAEAGDAELVDSLLRLDFPHNVDPNILGYALVKAAEANHTVIAIKLAEAGASLNCRDCSSVLGHDCEENPGFAEIYLNLRERNPIGFALKHRNAEMFAALLEHCPDVYNDDYLPSSAVEVGDRSILERFITAGTCMAQTFEHAVIQGDLDTVRYLHCRCTLMDITGQQQESILSDAIERADSIMVKELISYGMAPGPRAVVAAVFNAPSILMTLLRSRSEAGQMGLGKANIVTAAAHVYYKALPESLLVPPSTIRWISPLGAAVLKDDGKHCDIVRRLLETNPELDRPAIAYESCRSDRHELGILETVLLLAIGTCETAMVLLLLQHGASVNLPAHGGLTRTPLQKAAEVGAWAVAILLLDHGANAKAPPAERNGGTALQLAAKGGYIGIAELLLDAGADIQAAGSKVHSRTALEAAAENGRYDMVKFLTLRTNYSDVQFEKAVAYAREKSHNAVADLLFTIRAKQRTHVLAIQRLTCVDCNALLSNASALKRHRRTACGDAAGRPRHVCEVCNRVFNRKDMMDRHVAVHEGTRVKCPRCGKDFSRCDSLSTHLRHCEQDQLYFFTAHSHRI
ncbi:Exocyst complex component 5 [Elasticomyces elasticus]|nr:Exocyst complex component 5 [Elasticomyces elasticus]